MINRERFFTPVRMRLFGGVLRQSQVEGMTALLNEWEARYPNGDPRWLAYELATTTWETAHTMQPIEEYGHGAGQSYGRPDPVTGKIYYGRGFVQLTWKANYQKMSGVVGVDLVNHPERALELPIAAAILFEGMEHGDFTGVGLPHFFNAATEDWDGARAIINGRDHDVDIGNLGRVYFEILTGAGA